MADLTCIGVSSDAVEAGTEDGVDETPASSGTLSNDLKNRVLKRIEVEEMLHAGQGSMGGYMY